MLNALKLLELCLASHKSVSFARDGSEFVCMTAAGTRRAPDLPTLLRDFAWETHDVLSFKQDAAQKEALKAERARAELLDAITEDGLQAGDVPLPALATIPIPSFEPDSHEAEPS